MISVRTLIFVHHVNHRAQTLTVFIMVFLTHTGQDTLLGTAFNDTALLLRSMSDALATLHSNSGTFLFLTYLSRWAATTAFALYFDILGASGIVACLSLCPCMHSHGRGRTNKYNEET